jgi:ureidoglycolate dehydrogenase (NAD+)
MRLGLDAIEALAAGTLRRHGVSVEQAASVARIMTWCEAVGRANFGLQRIPIHLKRLARGVLNGNPVPKFSALTPSLASLDGDNGFGYHIAELGMARAIALAREAGVACVGVHNSNFFGAGVCFVKMAADAGMIGLAMSNSFPKVAAHGGFLPVLGTNPFAFGAPARDGPHLLFDMATSALAGSTVREHSESGKPLPEGLAVDGEGKPITDAKLVDSGALLPFGGAKGFGLSLMVELLAGVLTGAGISGGVGSMYKDFTRGGDNGHMLMAIDVSRWMPMPDYFSRMEQLLALVKASSPSGSVLFPGEVRWERFAESERSGVEVSEETLEALRKA